MEETAKIIEYLRTNKDLLRKRFGVTRLGIFGSFVTREQHCFK